MLETDLAIRGAQPSSKTLLSQPTEGEFTRPGGKTLSTYTTSIGVQRSQLNAFLDGARTVAVNVGQFFDGTAHYVGKLFSACFPRAGGRQAVIGRLVEEHALQYDIAEVHCARFSYILWHFFSDETEDELSLEIAPLVHLIARWKAIAGMTSFLMLTQPSSYKGSSYAEVFECWQRLVDLYERGLVKQSVVTALSDFHSGIIPVQKLLTIVHEAECTEIFPSKDPSWEEGDGSEIKTLHMMRNM